MLFSDGTGNSASKPFKTNVWRTYQAVDLVEPQDPALCRQIAFYRDGVGTETFKPLAAVGSAFGFGVMKEVRALYSFLCRNYEVGDAVYAFGFSRGAFTIRLLTGLMARCGIIRAQNETHLRSCVDYAYSVFRRDYLIPAAGKRKMIYRWILPPPYYLDDKNQELRLPYDWVPPKMEFVGLWDTVDAYGMPVEELKQAVDDWIWPMTLPERKIAPFIKKARHALSLDDERPSFRPVLWTENDEEDRAKIEQVWFPGVHANVGGGYPIDDLAHVPLLWVLEGAEGAGLRMLAEPMKTYRSTADPHGRAYDSRSGVAGYYRYGPRSVSALCNDKRFNVHIAQPTFHSSVGERIARCQVRYAPVSLPLGHKIEDRVTGRCYAQNKEYHKSAWDVVWWRRVVYFVTVFVSMMLVFMPVLNWLRRLDRPCTREDPNCWVGSASKYAPQWLRVWTNAFADAPWLSAFLIGILIWLFFIKSEDLQRWIGVRSEQAWADLKGQESAASLNKPVGLDGFARNVRTSKRTKRLSRRLEKASPFILGFLLLLSLIVGPIVGASWVISKIPPELMTTISIVGAATLAIWVCFDFVRTEGWRHRISTDLAAAYGPSRDLRLPERVWSYDKAYLDNFVAKADQVFREDRRTALESYHLSVLLYRDVLFAIGLTALIVLAGSLVLRHAQAWSWLSWAAGISIGLGILYGLADVLEDFVLSHMFARRSCPLAQSRIANSATRTKMVTLAASGTGAVAFALLMVASHFSRARKR